MHDFWTSDQFSPPLVSRAAVARLFRRLNAEHVARWVKIALLASPLLTPLL